MEDQVKQNKESSITIRLSKSELEILETKMIQAGYQAAGAFIRDFVISSNVKQEISGDVVQIAGELMNLASMINAEYPGDALLEKVKHIARINVGGVQ
ncbi:hypothetical protein ABFV43_11185 [Pseudomonas fulva]|uniref:hypothetical protein n=1 Tax=Pseudomonas TaxID=286 RepID=UPI00071F2C32|nr:hypothetical protein [Pseudomonas sp. URMO17WK12:I11]CRN04621.1 hypothetical protein PYEL_03380 [Pseudomonas sp. URMO17WK12:I11]